MCGLITGYKYTGGFLDWRLFPEILSWQCFQQQDQRRLASIVGRRTVRPHWSGMCYLEDKRPMGCTMFKAAL